MLTKNEKNFLLEILDQVSVRGIVNKTMVVVIMEKLSHEKDTDIDTPASDDDAS